MAALLAGADARYDVGDDHPLSGWLVPDQTLDDGRRVAELLHEARPALLDFDGRFGDTAGGWAIVSTPSARVSPAGPPRRC